MSGVDIRGTCSKSYDHLVFEWARYEMALGWLKACPEARVVLQLIPILSVYFLYRITTRPPTLFPDVIIEMRATYLP